MKILLLSLVAMMVISAQAMAATYVDPSLNQFLNTKSVQTTRIVVLLKYPTNLPAPRRYDGPSVKKYLMQMYQSSVKNVAATMQSNPQDIRLVEQLWISNSLALDVTPNGLRALVQNPVVEKIYANRKIIYSQPVSVRAVRNTREGADFTYGLKDIGIEKLFAERPDIQGQGVVAGLIDTGIDGKHPALKGKIALFYDAAANKVTEPVDRQTHGTHTTGTILGGDRESVKIGVAPQAKMIGSGALDGYDKMLKAMQFMLDPDGNPNTNDSPRLISNSWNAQGAPDIELFYRAITAWEAAGVLPVFSAGNAGPGAQTITKPHEHPSVLAIGATDSNFKIASFSSRGPGIFQGKQIQKPDFTAPGVNVLSTVPGGRFEEMSGTSMACPHAAGIATLLYQVNPKFTPQNVREIMMKTLRFVDASGNPIAQPVWNAAYGFGRLDAYAAIKAALGLARSRIASGFDLIQVASAPVMNAQWFDVQESDAGVADITAAYTTDEANWLVVK
jgi:subtilisin family serine protease